MKFLDAGFALLKEFEGCALVAYPDPATGDEPWTIGYGCTDGVTPHMAITQEEAEQRLIKRVLEFCALVDQAVSRDLTDSQFTAAVCFAYNVKRWQSTPLFAFLKTGETERAESHWTLYCKANGKEMPGLKRRREAELSLFRATTRA